MFGVNYKRPAYLSSRDGIRWTPESFETFNQTVTHHKFQNKVVVPALHKEGLRRMGLKVGNWRGMSDAIAMALLDHTLTRISFVVQRFTTDSTSTTVMFRKPIGVNVAKCELNFRFT